MGSCTAKAAFGVGCALVIALEVVALARWQGWWPQRAGPVAAVAAVAPVAAVPPAAPPVAEPQPQQQPQSPAGERRYAHLRERLRWEPLQLGRELHVTPDVPSRLLLAKSAAEEARLHEVGLGFADVYGLITAETSWVPRDGRSRDGTPNLGVAQFEPATAQAVGLRDPHDVVEAVHAAARHMREAAEWSRQRIAGLGLSPGERAERLREGVSVYYNLSSRGRSAWTGSNAHQLPAPTRQHIRNARAGAAEALLLDTRMRRAGPPARPGVRVAGGQAGPEVP